MKVHLDERKKHKKNVRTATTSCYNAVVGWASAHPVKITNESTAIVLCLNLCSEHLCFTAPRDCQALCRSVMVYLCRPFRSPVFRGIQPGVRVFSQGPSHPKG